MVENKKLIIGHNMLLDIIFILRQFIVDLPSTLEEFKSTVSSFFPFIIDTKLMASKTPFKVSHLFVYFIMPTKEHNVRDVALINLKK